MIHKIKALHDQGHGLSIRQIARQLNISRNTVRKYLSMDEQQIHHQFQDRKRHKQLDQYETYLRHQLSHAEELSAVKLKRRLKQNFPNYQVSDRTLRRFVAKLKGEVAVAQRRYYQPVLDMVAGVQCQVDPGELRNVMIAGQARTVYFVVFVLSYSRLMYVAASFKPIDTSIFIQMHDAAFRYFGGCPEEVVYDQTKLVVLSEKYRELELNQRMAQYATEAGFTIGACEGYDPESKGKVEAGVKYVKQNALYDESFRDESHLHDYLANWLDTVANHRVHGTTGQQPWALYEAEEKAKMRSYLSPPSVNLNDQPMTRQVDKTGLISYQSVKYSVPMAWQRQVVVIEQDQGQLIIRSPHEHQEIARHDLSHEKGTVIKKNHHYRDLTQAIAELRDKVVTLLGQAHGGTICDLLKATAPKIYRDQLAGVLKIVDRLGVPNQNNLQRLAQRPSLTAKGLEEYLLAAQENPQPALAEDTIVVRNASLARYSNLERRGGSHAIH